MPGPVALVGALAFLPATSDFDAGLLRSTGRTRPRVVIVPTAAYPDGEEAFSRHAADGVAHFGALGAEVEPLMIHDRDAHEDILSILAGLVLGPSLLGALFPAFSKTLWDPSTSTIFAGVAQVGLIFLMFQIGLEFEFKEHQIGRAHV